jgi:hypothetical protein
MTRWGALLLVALGRASAATDAASAEFFESKIRPVLANHCFACHTASALGGLRLDSREAMMKGGGTGPAVMPGDPDRSLLITAVRQTGELKMPKGAKLRADEIASLTEWVRAGAVWPASAKVVQPATSGYTPEQRNFWSFQPLRTPPVPAVKDAQWPKTAIDRFILARLEKEGLRPVAMADRRTLIRRASLDLTGLPPTQKEVQDFETDKSADAFAKVVDRLLASPHYGERWGRLWLDVARYGEDDYRSLDPMGRGFAPYANAYLYRDWVIKAFNDDQPYDTFVKAQLAADLMDEKQQVKLLPALGFLGQGPWYYDNGAVEITRADERHDRVDVVTRGFLGLTVGCARCHDHKYDPIPQRDYYALAGVFASSSYHEYPRVPKAVVAEYKALEQKLKDRQALLNDFTTGESRQLAEALALQISRYMQSAWKVAGEPKKDKVKVVEEDKLDYELFDRFLKFLAKPPQFYPYLKPWQEMVKKGGTAEEAKKLAGEFQSLVLEVLFERRRLKDENEIIVAKSLPGTKKKEPLFKPNEFITNDDFCPGCALELKAMTPERTNLWTDVFQRNLDGGDLTLPFGDFQPGLLSFRGWALERQLSAERRAYIKALRDDIDKMRKEMPKEYPFVHGVRDEAKPVNLPLSLRGSPYSLGGIVPRGFLTVLSPEKEPVVFQNGSGRLELANAILRQPIAMRVAVNRVWKWHFGAGIVDSPSNFGVLGERPSHPELLEYLASSFAKNGMSMKKLHREIMLSAVYQLSAADHPANFEKDSANRLLWRANRRRMDAEQIRDSLLSVAGALDEKLYGPSEALTPASTRRTVYSKVSRYKLDDYLQLFDFPSPSITAEQRFATNIPSQRLFFMNSDFVQQQAELLAKRTAEEPTTRARIEKLYGIVFGRAPSADELNTGIEFLKTEPLRDYEERKKAAAEKKSKGDPAPAPPKPSPEMEGMNPNGMLAGMAPGATPETKKKLMPVTAWGRYAKILLSSTEFSFIE